MRKPLDLLKTSWGVRSSFLLSILLFFPTTLIAAVPTHQIDEAYIREWLVLGAFHPDDLDVDYLVDSGGELGVNPEEGDSVNNGNSGSLTWQRYNSQRDEIKIIDALGPNERATAYAFCIIESERAGFGVMLLGSDDGACVYFNGKRVLRRRGPRSFTFDNDRFAVELHKGENRCLVKIDQGVADWAFSVRVLLPDSAVVEGRILNENEMPVGGSSVELFQEGDQTESTVSDEGGNYQISVYPAEGVYDLRATNKKMGNWRRGIELRSGERVKVDLIIRNSISISGTIRMLDNSTPVTSMPIELVKLKPDSPLSLPTLKPDHFDEVYSTTLSNLDGDFQFVNLLSGEYIVGSSTLSVELGVKKKSCIMKFHGFGNDFSRAFGAG